MRWLLAVVLALPFLSISFLTPQTSKPLAVTESDERPVQALYQLEQAAAESGWTGESALQAGLAWKKLGNTPRAVTYFEMASQLDLDNADIWRALAEGYLDLQRWSLATVALTRTAELDTQADWARFHLGLLQAATAPESAGAYLAQIRPDSQYAPVIEEVSQALKSDEAAMQVGLTLAQHHLWSYAELAFFHTLTFNNPLPEAYAYLGLARNRQGKDGSAAIEQAVNSAPDNALVRYLQGLHLRLKGDNQLSLDAFLRAATLDAENPAYAAELGAAYQLIGDSQLAEEWLQKAVTLSNDDPRFQQLLDQFLSQ